MPRTVPRSTKGLRSLFQAFMATSIVLLATPTMSHADKESAPDWLRALDNDFYKISLDIRARLEVADRDGLDPSDAWTLRTRLGIGTKPIAGFSAFAEVENIFAIDSGGYFDIVSRPNGRTPIADPQNTELNRLWLQYANAEALGLKVKAGRQRIILDDARFVGNVGWRQNEQTFDSALLQSSFGVEGLTATYAYLWDVRRIFGNRGPAGTRDFDSDSHLVNLSYGKLPGGAKIAAFAYLLDIDDSPGNSSNSYGLRLSGGTELSDGWKLLYAFSYAYQTDAANNPVDYGAHYVAAEAGLGMGAIGTFKVGYELLGSDDGKARFVTPLATAHKFNGFADVFLNNGGANGLQDLYATYAPKLPWGLGGFITYHHFWSDENSRDLGDEIDFVLKRKFGPVEVLTKGAFFFGDSSGPGPGIADIWRVTLQATYKF